MNRNEACGVASKVNLCKALGKLEVLDPEDEDYTKTGTSGSLEFNSPSTEFASKRPVSLQNGKLQVLGPKEEVFIPPCDAASRPGSAAGRQGSAGRKSYIPTRQIPLCTVKPLAQSSNIPDYRAAPSMKTNTSQEEVQKTSSIPANTDEKGTTGPQSLEAIHKDNFKGRLEESSEEDESDDDAGRAPIELLAEFISAVMDANYQVAHKLCQMILLYEPDNPEAKQFSPLIEEKMKIEEEQSCDDEDSEDSDEETDEDTTDTDDDDDVKDDEGNHCTAKHNS